MKYPIPEKIPLRKREWLDRELTKAPIWCSVDLRDGNQALPMPMNPEKKLEYFKLLCAIGFKEIEVSFPSASQDDFDFVRNLIEKKEIPSDVRISVLTQAREPLIRRTVESLVGVEKAILHLYVATSDLHEQIVFGKQDYFVKEDTEYKNEIKWIIPNAQKNTIEPIYLTLQAGGSTCPDTPHEGEEFGYVLQGAVSIHLGNKTYKAKKGESFYFKADSTHYIQAGQKTGAVLIWVSTPPSF